MNEKLYFSVQPIKNLGPWGVDKPDPNGVDRMNCCYCNSSRVWKYGIRKNKRGLFQKYKCKDCKKQFIDDDFLHMQTRKEVVAFAIRLWRKGLSLTWIAEEIRIVYGVNRNPTVVCFWVKRFIQLFEAVNALPLLGISKRLHFDYTYLKIGGEDAYLWALKCPETKLIAGWIITTTRSLDDAKSALCAAKRNFLPGYRLEEIVTDGEQSFPRAIWEVFDHDVEHYRYKGFVDKKNNNMIETLWRFKDHTPQFRTPAQAIRFFTIWVAVYNIKKSREVSQSYAAYKLAKIIEICPEITIQVL